MVNLGHRDVRGPSGDCLEKQRQCAWKQARVAMVSRLLCVTSPLFPMHGDAVSEPKVYRFQRPPKSRGALHAASESEKALGDWSQRGGLDPRSLEITFPLAATLQFCTQIVPSGSQVSSTNTESGPWLLGCSCWEGTHGSADISLYFSMSNNCLSNATLSLAYFLTSSALHLQPPCHVFGSSGHEVP